MDVLRPQLIYIDGRCYRKNQSQDTNITNERSDFDDEYLEPLEDDAYEDEICDAFTDIEQTENGFRLRLSVPSAFYKFIIGKKGETKKRIESETKTQISIPRQGQTGDIVVTGKEKRGVSSAKTRIEMLVDSGRQKTPFTHFLSIPINGPAVVDKFYDFRDDILKQCAGYIFTPDEGVDETIFQVPEKLHITIGTMVLVDDKEVQAAVQLLQDCRRQIVHGILEGKRLDADVKKLEYMNDDPTAVDVLYAQVTPTDGSDVLQQIAESLVDRFENNGIMNREYDRVKLHITLLNTLMRKDPTGSTEPKRDGGPRPPRQRQYRDREAFDASNILKYFGNYNFGREHINTIHLSTRYTKGQDGYYECAGSIQLP